MSLKAAILGGTASLLAATAVQAADSCSNSLKVSYPAPVAADGWSYRLVANGLKKPRGILFDSEDSLIVVDSGVGLKHFTFNDNGGDCLYVDKQTTLVENEDLNHGIALTQDGKTLYASSTNEAFAWSYDAKAGSVSGSGDVVIKNMSGTDHTTRTLYLSPMHPGVLVVSRGSQSNVDNGSKNLNSGHSQIRAYNLSELNDGKSSFDFLEGKVLGWGLRNSVGVVEHPETGGIWAVENSVDELSRSGKDIHEDNPAEELNFLGYLNGSTAGKQGGNHGYPHCFTVWGTEDFPQRGSLKTGDQFPAETEKSLTNDDCNNDYIPPRLAFQAHMAPLDMVFTASGTEAFVSFHGSWDRSDPVGYHVASIDFAKGEPTEAQDSTSAAKDVLTSPDLSQCPDNCIRPVGLAWDSKGRLWVSSDATGEIFVLYNEKYEDAGNATSSGGSGGSGDGDESAGFQILPTSWGWTIGVLAISIGLLLA